MSGKYNLVIIHTPGLQDVADFEAVRSRLAKTDRDIDVAIVSVNLDPQQLRVVESGTSGAATITLTADPRGKVWSALTDRPTLLFSPVPVHLPSEIRGHRLIARHKSKLEEIAMLSSEGFPVPHSAPLTRDLDLDEGTWGSMVIVKPTTGRGGHAVRLMRTADVQALIRSTPSELGHGPLMVQRWIDTGPHVNFFRAMTVLDRVVLVYNVEALDPATLSGSDAGAVLLDIDRQLRRRRQVNSGDRDVYDLAARIARQVDFSPTFGIDIVREHATGRMFVLELNSGFPTWHLSSRGAKRKERTMGTFTLAERYGQYNALDAISDALALATRRLAR